jgi:hypothetical protein
LFVISDETKPGNIIERLMDSSELWYSNAMGDDYLHSAPIDPRILTPPAEIIFHPLPQEPQFNWLAVNIDHKILKPTFDALKKVHPKIEHRGEAVSASYSF